MLRTKSFVFLVLICLTTLSVQAQPNILFIAVDDLNDMITILDKESPAKTPNLEKLAAKSTLFTEAYASSTVCNASRFSILHGVMPSKSGVYVNTSNTYEVEDEFVNIFDFYRNKGYQAIGVGKLFHGKQNIASAWDEYYGYEKNKRATQKSYDDFPISWGEVNGNLLDQRDLNIVQKSSEILAKKFEKPTFLAVGLYSPHLPWFFTEDYFEKYSYPLAEIKKPEQPFYDLDDLPRKGKRFAKQYNYLNDMNYHEKIVEQGEWKKAIRSYLVAIAYMDENLGKLLDAFENSPNKDDTIVVFWSDHGYHLGEKQHWNKHALWRKTTHVPLMISMPKQEQGQVCDKVVSLLDLFPTLADLSGFKIPKQLQGRSLKVLLEDPNTTWSNYAVSTMERKNHSVFTERWHYIRYINGDEELYDRKFDPNEFFNIEKLASLKSIKKQLREFFPKKNESAVKEIDYKADDD